jgi:hypothetical protein
MRDPGVHPVKPVKTAQIDKSPPAATDNMDNAATEESPEKEQERMLMQKYGNLKTAGGQKFLQKRMQPQRVGDDFSLTIKMFRNSSTRAIIILKSNSRRRRCCRRIWQIWRASPRC